MVIPMKMEKKKEYLLAAILNGLCAVIWTGLFVADFVFQLHTEYPIRCILHILCALIWGLSCWVQFRHYRAQH